MLAAHIISILWSKPGVGYGERCFLLWRLVQYIEGSTVYKAFGHFAPGTLADFVGNIEEESYKLQKISKEEYVHKMANSPQMGWSIDPFCEQNDNTIDWQGYRLASVSDLYTLWDEQEYHVEVYQRDSDGKVVLRYPANDDGQEDEYEGADPSENFRLVLKEGSDQALFDGGNGELLDTEGQKIVVFRGSKTGV